jgi:solute carrier family 25 oxoglutarate transporter 11
MTTTASPFVNFSTAGMGGIIGWTIVHPLNTLSVRMNLSLAQKPSASVKHPSFLQFTRQLIHKEGTSALYEGITAGWTRQIFYSTSVFGFYEIFRDFLRKTSNGNEEITYAGRFLAGIGSGCVAALLSCPAEMTLVRMSNDLSLPPSQRRNYSNVLNAFSRIWKEEGFQTFYRGVEPFVYRAMIVGAVQIGTYDHCRQYYRENFRIVHPTLNVFAAAMTSGFLYSFVTMPLETIKNRLSFFCRNQILINTAVSVAFRGNVRSNLKKIIQEEGITRLWKGYFPYYLRCGLHTLVMFMSIELLRSLY